MRPQTMVVDPPVTLTPELDQRQTQRHPLSQCATISVVGATKVLQGEIRNVSKGGTQLQVGQPLLSGSLLRVEYDNNLLLGEVIYCQQEQPGWIVGIRVEHSLSGINALAEAIRGSW
jgi:hypothetical protein